MKRTYQPKKRQRSKVHGFRKRMASTAGRNVLKRSNFRNENTSVRLVQQPAIFRKNGAQQPFYPVSRNGFSVFFGNGNAHSCFCRRKIQ